MFTTEELQAIDRKCKGEVVALYPLMPDRMKVDRDGQGRLYYEIYGL